MMSSTTTSGLRDRTLAQLVDTFQASGRYVFSRDDAMAAFGSSETALQNAARRLAAKGRLVMPRRGFFVVVPLEYRSAGAPPPSWFISELMRFHARPYYVGLLSAAAIHGAAHQQPQVFQVVTDRPLRPATAGRSRILFFHKRQIRSTPTSKVRTETGTMRVSTPEATALDLVRYVAEVGHLGNVATVLAELAEEMDGTRLVEAACAGVEFTVVQRLGYLLDDVGFPDLTDPLAHWLADQRPRLTPLRPDRPKKEVPRNQRWKVAVNETVEVDV